MRWMFAGLSVLTLSAAIWLWDDPEDKPPPKAAAPVNPTRKPARVAAADPPPVERLVASNSALPPTAPEPALEDDDTPDDGEYGDDDDGPKPERTEAERLAEERVVLQRTYSALDARFGAQQRDSAWSAAAEANLEGAFQSSLEGDGKMRVEDVECGAELCRSSFAVEDKGARRQFVAAFTANGPPGLEHHFKYEETRTTIYSIRRDDALLTED